MENVKTTISPDGKKLTIECDLENPGYISDTGKSQVVATTRGFQVLDGTQGVKLSLNLTRPVPKKG